MHINHFSGILAALVLSAGTIAAQTPAASGVSFEVASIKPAAPLDPVKIAQQMQQGIPPHVGMKIDNARVDIGYMSITDITAAAYKVKAYQIVGPDWMASQRFDILAKLPDGATKDQVPEMLQNLLAERFKLAIHREKKDQAVYELSVGKNGPKLKESPPDPALPADAEAGGGTAPKIVPLVKNEGNGSVTVSGGAGGTARVQMMPNGQMHLEASKMTMAQLADSLTKFLGRPVVDKTGLAGNYQVSLDLSMEDLRAAAASAGVNVPRVPAAAAAGNTTSAPDPSGSSLFANIQDLGLKLDSRKDPVDMIVIDHLEKVPTEN